MNDKTIIAGIALAGIIASPALAAKPAALEDAAQTAGEQVDQQRAKGKNKADKAHKSGHEKPEGAVAETEKNEEEGKNSAHQQGEKARNDATHHAEEHAEKARKETGHQQQPEDSADDSDDKGRKDIPPGLAKKEQHPSTGKGSAQGQESRAKQEKKWWRFWQ